MSCKNPSNIDAHVLKKFNIVQQVGSGAYGIVWKVTAKDSTQHLALKKIFDAFQHATDAQRTYRQVAVLQQLEHPNIVKLYETMRAQNNKDLYMTMEYVDADLYQVIVENLLKDVHKKFIVYQMAKALKYLHSGSLIHRDLKPSNVLINSSCHVKICDFGLVRCLASNKKQNEQTFNLDQVLTQGVATRWYRAPEVLLGSKNYSTPADVWSLGCVVFQMVTGKPLFPGNNTAQTLEKILQVTGVPSDQDIESLGSQNAKTMIDALKSKTSKKHNIFKGIDPEFIDILTKMLQFSPKKRITMNQLLQHSIVSKFRKPQQQIQCQGPITTILDDNKKQTVDRYRLMIYGKRNSLSKISSTNSFSSSSKNLPKVKSEKIISFKQESSLKKQGLQKNQLDKSIKPVMKYIKSTENLAKAMKVTDSQFSKQVNKPEVRKQSQGKPQAAQAKPDFSKSLTYFNMNSSKTLKKTSQKPGNSLTSSIKRNPQRDVFIKVTNSVLGEVKDNIKPIFVRNK